MLNINSTYSRKDNIIYEGNIPIVKLKQKFIDVDKLSVQGIEYMNRYIDMFPNLIEVCHQKQLSLF